MQVRSYPISANEGIGLAFSGHADSDFLAKARVYVGDAAHDYPVVELDLSGVSCDRFWSQDAAMLVKMLSTARRMRCQGKKIYIKELSPDLDRTAGICRLRELLRDYMAEPTEEAMEALSQTEAEHTCLVA